MAQTLVLELYLKGKPVAVVGITGDSTYSPGPSDVDAAVSIVERMDCLEASSVSRGAMKELNQKQMDQ